MQCSDAEAAALIRDALIRDALIRDTLSKRKQKSAARLQEYQQLPAVTSSYRPCVIPIVRDLDDRLLRDNAATLIRR